MDVWVGGWVWVWTCFEAVRTFTCVNSLALLGFDSGAVSQSSSAWRLIHVHPQSFCPRGLVAHLITTVSRLLVFPQLATHSALSKVLRRRLDATAPPRGEARRALQGAAQPCSAAACIQ